MSSNEPPPTVDESFLSALTPEQRQVFLNLDRGKEEANRKNADLDRGKKEADERAAAAEKRAAEAEKRTAEAEKRTAEAEKLAAEARKLVDKTDYVTYLRLSHEKVFSTFQVQENPDLTSAGSVADVDDKFYPLYLRTWDAFPALHDSCQEKLMSTLGTDKYFDPEIVVEKFGVVADKGPVQHEDDVRKFEFFAVEYGTCHVLERYLMLQQEAEPLKKLPGAVCFLYRPYGLNLEKDAVKTLDTPAYLVNPPEAYRLEDVDRGFEPPPAKRSTGSRKRLYPDQWCFSEYSKNDIVPIFVVEYKAAHKLRADKIVKALDSVGDEAETGGLFAEAIRIVNSNKTSVDEEAKATEHAKRDLAQVIVQAFHYMVEFGLCYSYVTSGEAILLLYLDPADPLTLYYHFGLPKADVGEVDETAQDLGKLKHTANALALTLVMLAQGTPPLSQRWKTKARADLKPWPQPYGQITNPGTDSHVSSFNSKKYDSDGDSDYKDAGSSKKPAKTQAVVHLTRSAARNQPDSGSSSSSTQQGGTSGHTRTPAPYCTQACLLGLRYGRVLDEKCPNVQRHRLGEADTNRHLLSAEDFLARMREQLAHDLDDDCEGLDKNGKFGATSMLFRLELQPHGYTLVAKGVQQAHVSMLLHEFRIYSEPRIMAQQGRLVPVCLGMIRLEVEYVSYTGAHITHMLLLSYGGEPLWTKTKSPMLSAMETAAREAWDELLRLGVLHGDERSPNVVWNEELQRVMCIDFGQAELKPPPRKKRPSGDMSSYKRHKWTAT